MSSLATQTKQKQSIQTALKTTTPNDLNCMTGTIKIGDVAGKYMRKVEVTGLNKFAKVNSGNSKV